MKMTQLHMRCFDLDCLGAKGGAGAAADPSARNVFRVENKSLRPNQHSTLIFPN